MESKTKFRSVSRPPRELGIMGSHVERLQRLAPIHRLRNMKEKRLIPQYKKSDVTIKKLESMLKSKILILSKLTHKPNSNSKPRSKTFIDQVSSANYRKSNSRLLTI